MKLWQFKTLQRPWLVEKYWFHENCSMFFFYKIFLFSWCHTTNRPGSFSKFPTIRFRNFSSHDVNFVSSNRKRKYFEISGFKSIEKTILRQNNRTTGIQRFAISIWMRRTISRKYSGSIKYAWKQDLSNDTGAIFLSVYHFLREIDLFILYSL